MNKEQNYCTVFDIARCCLNDGPGIRTTVFLKGCPLRCVWCHNPESQNTSPEILFSSQKCIQCGACSDSCEMACHTLSLAHTIDRTACIGCGACVNACPTGALRLAGRNMTVDEILCEVLKDRTFYGTSGGGLTVSGGEPMLHINFLEQLLGRAKQEGISTAIETCGYSNKESFERIAPLTDYFLYDYKESDPKKHRLFTGRDNRIILENLELLDRLGANVILRIPMIPEYNDTTENLTEIRELVKKFHSIKRIEVLPYHPLGVSKGAELGMAITDGFKVPDKEALYDFIQKLGEGLGIMVDACI